MSRVTRNPSFGPKPNPEKFLEIRPDPWPFPQPVTPLKGTPSKFI